jgi:hypothetical protein
LTVKELRTIFFEALPTIKKTKYKFRASNKGPNFKRSMESTYKEKIRELELLARLID